MPVVSFGVDVEGARRRLVHYVREQADWRRRMAGEHPEDGRNLRAASALDGWADWLEHVPPGHPALRRVAALQQPHDPDRFTPAEETQARIAKLGFRRYGWDTRQEVDESDFRALLAALAQLEFEARLEGLAQELAFAVEPEVFGRFVGARSCDLRHPRYGVVARLEYDDRDRLTLSSIAGDQPWDRFEARAVPDGLEDPGEVYDWAADFVVRWAFGGSPPLR